MRGIYHYHACGRPQTKQLMPTDSLLVFLWCRSGMFSLFALGSSSAEPPSKGHVPCSIRATRRRRWRNGQTFFSNCPCWILCCGNWVIVTSMIVYLSSSVAMCLPSCSAIRWRVFYYSVCNSGMFFNIFHIFFFSCSSSFFLSLLPTLWLAVLLLMQALPTHAYDYSRVTCILYTTHIISWMCLLWYTDVIDITKRYWLTWALSFYLSLTSSYLCAICNAIRWDFLPPTVCATQGFFFPFSALPCLFFG